MVEQETVKVAGDLAEWLDGALSMHFKAFEKENAMQLKDIAQSNAAKALQQCKELAQAEVMNIQNLWSAAKSDLDGFKIKAQADLDSFKLETQKDSKNFLESLDTHKLEIDAAVVKHLSLLNDKTMEKIAELADFKVLPTDTVVAVLKSQLGMVQERLAEQVAVKELPTDSVVAALKDELASNSPALAECRLLISVLNEKIVDNQGAVRLLFAVQRQLDGFEVKQLKQESVEFKEALPALLAFDSFLKFGIAAEPVIAAGKPKLAKVVTPQPTTSSEEREWHEKEVKLWTHKVNKLRETCSYYKKQIDDGSGSIGDDKYLFNIMDELKSAEATLAKLKVKIPKVEVEKRQEKVEGGDDSFTLDSEGGIK